MEGVSLMEGIRAELVGFTPDYMDILRLSAGKCYGKEVSHKGIQNIINSGHLSVLEHCNAIFDVDCSVAVLGQLTRHRHLSFTVKSARGSEFEKFINPYYFDDLEKEIWLEGSMDRAVDDYKTALAKGIPYENARYLLPQGIQTSLIVSGNFRAWYEYLGKRLCHRAMPEHRQLAEIIHTHLQLEIPEVFNRDFKNCKNCKEKGCSFYG